MKNDIKSNKSIQLYQFELGIKVIFNPKLNVWQVIDSKKSYYDQILFEVIGYDKSDLVFDYAKLLVKKYRKKK